MLRELNCMSLAALLAIGCSIGLSLLPAFASAAETTDHRERIVESSLRDLSISNDAAIARQRVEPVLTVDAQGNPQVVLKLEQPMPADEVVSIEVQSSLHRLRRETVSEQAVNGRKARVDENLERASGR